MLNKLLKHIPKKKILFVFSINLLCLFESLADNDIEKTANNIEKQNDDKLENFKGGIAITFGALWTNRWYSFSMHESDFVSSDDPKIEFTEEKKSDDKNGPFLGFLGYGVYRPSVHIGFYFDLGYNFYQFSVIDYTTKKFYDVIGEIDKNRNESYKNRKLISDKTENTIENYKYKIHEIRTKIAGRWYPIWVPLMYLSLGMSLNYNLGTSISKDTSIIKKNVETKSNSTVDKDDLSNFEIGAYFGIGFEVKQIFLELYTITNLIDKFREINPNGYPRNLRTSQTGLQIGYNLLSLF